MGEITLLQNNLPSPRHGAASMKLSRGYRSARRFGTEVAVFPNAEIEYEGEKSNGENEGACFSRNQRYQS